MTTFGIEEEYLLLDPATGYPAFASTEVETYLQRSPRVDNEDVQRELLSCQLETSTPPCNTAGEALSSLSTFRNELNAAALKSRVRAAAVGTAPRLDTDATELTDKQRYYRIKENARAIVVDQYCNGQHVHVGIPDREAGVQALNRIGPWLPIITALSANSPYWQGRDSGFASWRTVHFRRWPIQGIPPLFADAADYDRRVDGLLRTGTIFDRGLVTWMARLSDNYPTLEVRAADVQLTAEDSVLLAVLVRGLVATALEEAGKGTPPHEVFPELLDAALWQAGRHGLEGELVNTRSGNLIPGHTAVDLFLEHIGSALEASGDAGFAREGVERLKREGTGSRRQRAAYERGGMPALIDLYSTSLTAAPATSFAR